MEIPKWKELSDKDRRILIELASSHGIDNGEDRLILPSPDEALGMAIELYTLSRSIISNTLKETQHG